VAYGFEDYAERSRLAIFACAVLPDHVHLVLRRHHLKVEQLVVQLKGAATQRLVEEKIHPFQDLPHKNGCPPKSFARGEWKVFLNTDDDIRRAIECVENNPLKEGLRRQCWRFVTPLFSREAEAWRRRARDCPFPIALRCASALRCAEPSRRG
jgi:REP element-mobilizing transposase RayT